LLKNAYFLEKKLKRSPQHRGLHPRTLVCLQRLGAKPSDPRVVTPAYYYNFFEFIFGAKCVLLSSKKNKITTINVLFSLHPHFCLIFSSNSVIFVDRRRRRKNIISWRRAQSTPAMPLLGQALNGIASTFEWLNW